MVEAYSTLYHIGSKSVHVRLRVHVCRVKVFNNLSQAFIYLPLSDCRFYEKFQFGFALLELNKYTKLLHDFKTM